MPTIRSAQSHVVVLSKPDLLHWLFVALLAGALVWLDLYYVAIPLLLFWMFASTGKTTLEIDVKAHHYRTGSQVLGIHLSDWHPLPEAQRVVVRYFSEYNLTTTREGIEEAHQNAEFIVLLSVPNGSQGFILFRHLHHKDAVRVACAVGRILQLEVVEFNRQHEASTIQEAHLLDNEA